MCSNDEKPRPKPQPEIRRIGDAEQAAINQDTQGYIDAGGLEGDRKRAAVDSAMRTIRDYSSPLAGLGVFARREVDGTGAGEMKTNFSTANPFYATMAATAEAQARRTTAATQPQVGPRPPLPTRPFKIGG